MVFPSQLATQLPALPAHLAACHICLSAAFASNAKGSNRLQMPPKASPSSLGEKAKGSRPALKGHGWNNKTLPIATLQRALILHLLCLSN